MTKYPWPIGLPIIPRRSYDPDNPSGYMESDSDYLSNNRIPAVWLLDHAEGIVTALQLCEKALADYGDRHHGGIKAEACFAVRKLLNGGEDA